MKTFRTAILCIFWLLCFAGEIFGQQVLVAAEKKQQLTELSTQQNSLFLSNHQKALELAKTYGWPVLKKTKNGGIALLQGVNSLGFPVYLVTDNNTTAAATTQTNKVQTGGVLGLTLSGSSLLLNNKLAIWDGGNVYRAHQEFAGKTITLHDSTSVIDHATHVAGTMIAKGVYPQAKGMAFNASTLQSYYFNNDVTEMSAAASGLLLSNHSYGDEAGWSFNSGQNHWEWYGLPGDSVDYEFGFYGQRTQTFDKIAYNAPYYLIVESAGNSRANNGPAIGSIYYGYASRTSQNIVNKGPRPGGISNNDGYDIISTTGNAKNILTVGAVNPLPYGPPGSSDISIAYFSSWGPTDDGRVKPDIVADGIDVTSTGNASPTSYLTFSGTSMAAPNVTGSLYLLQEYYAQKNNNNFMRAATLKGLACHTAFDAGRPGPDYIYGWGLLDMSKAAQAITDNGTKSMITESTLSQGQQQVYHVIASGNGALAVTIAWTDPAGTPTTEGLVNNRTPKLINDLDISVSDGTTTFKPWILDPANPSLAAKTGDNIVDNVEQVFIPGAEPGKAYTITVTHKATLQSGSQGYSMIVTGIGGAGYCTSGPLSNADSRVNSIAISDLNYNQTAGCTTYTDHTDLTALLEQGKTYPLSITLGTCGANFNKAAKIFIDWNGNGTFEANELAATTPIINATGTYNTNISVPVTVVPGNFSLMRVVLIETNDPATIQPCGNYAKGETQDYRVQFLKTSTDAGAVAIVNPATTGSCAGASSVAITLKNFGSRPVSNIPVKITITAPDNTITTFNETYTGTLKPLEQGDFTLTNTFNATGGAVYQINATTNLPGDQISANNQVSETATINAAPIASNLAAYYCTNTQSYQLSGTGDGEVLWYQNILDKNPIAFGSPANADQLPANNTWYAGLNDYTGGIGPATKHAFSGGGYNQFSPGVIVNTKAPLIIQSARLYIGNSGKITFNVANTGGQIVSSTTINAVATRGNPLPGPQPDDPNDQGAVYQLNLLLPAAGKYTISTVYDSSATIYRNNSGVTGYPFKAGSIFSITGNEAQSASDTAYYKNFYYYFYDIKLKSAGCPSATRQAVTLKQPTITQNGIVLTSNFSSGNQWYLGDTAIPGATDATYTPEKTGIYQLMVMPNSSSCQLQSDKFVYVLIGSGQGSSSDIGLVLYPIPASSQLNIIFAAPAAGSLTLSIINASGQTVISSSQAISAGNFNTTLNVTNLPAGSYVLKIVLGQKIYNSKLVINR